MREIKFDDRNNNPVYIDKDSIIALEVAYLGNNGSNNTGTIIYAGQHRFVVIQDIQTVREWMKNAYNGEAN